MSQAQATIDPLTTLTLPTVIQRTGIPRATIMKLLALDVANKTPGHHFAAPMRRPGMTRLIWREKSLIEWMQVQEARVS